MVKGRKVERRTSCRVEGRVSPRPRRTGWNRALQLGLLLFAGFAQAAPTKLLKAGDQAMAEERFADAVNLYQEAVAAAPESAEAYYRLGNAHYRAGVFDEAAGAYEYAASVARSEATRGRSVYNMGNCMVRTGEQLRETDPQAAMNYCRQATWLYRAALEWDPDFADAAYNLEMTRRIAADIGEEIARQEAAEQQQNELIKYIREKLQEFIERQTALLETKNVGEPQQLLETETRALAKVMTDSGLADDFPLPDGTRAAGPLKESLTRVLAAADAMAAPDQPTALAELIAALGAAPEDPDQNEGESDEDSESDEDYDMDYEESDEDADMYQEADPFGDFSEYEEIRGVPPPNQTEMDILAEEVRNQERRKQKKAGEYKKVDKDW